jgi:hypothetical protein
VLSCASGGLYGDFLTSVPSHSSLQATGLWAQLESRKPVFREPRDAGKGFEKVMTDYKSSIQAGRGGLLFSVCRGKV